MSRDGEGVECLQQSSYGAGVASQFQSVPAICAGDELALNSTDRLSRPI
jgi:hypothetical protein